MEKGGESQLNHWGEKKKTKRVEERKKNNTECKQGSWGM